MVLHQHHWQMREIHSSLKKKLRPHTYPTVIVLPYKLTCAHKSSRVRAPPPICSTHCPHPPSWDKPWVTSEEYLSSLSCVLIWFNGTIHRRSGIATVDWRAKLKPHDTYQLVLDKHSVYQPYSTDVEVVQWS